MKALNLAICDLVRTCLVRHYERLTANTLLISILNQLTFTLNDLIRESNDGVALLQQFAVDHRLAHRSQIERLNAHGETIASLVSATYAQLWKLKPLLWEENTKLFDTLLVALHEKSLWVCGSYRDTYSPQMHGNPGSIRDISQYASHFIRSLLHIDLLPDGRLLLGKPLADILDTMRKAQGEDDYFLSGYPMPLEHNSDQWKDIFRRSKGRRRLNDWEMTLDVTRHGVPIHLENRHALSNFLVERKQVISELTTATDLLRQFTSTRIQDLSADPPQENLIRHTTAEILAHFQSMTHFHLDIRWNQYSEVSLSVTGPVALEKGNTISTTKIHKLISTQPDPNMHVDASDVRLLGEQLFNAIFVGCSWRDKGDSEFWKGEAYDGIITAYRRGREHAESKSREATFTVASRLTPYCQEHRDLQQVAFELLHDGDDFICLKYSFYRYPLETSSAPPFCITGGRQRALLVASNPAGVMENIPEVSDEIVELGQLLTANGIECDILKEDDATLHNILWHLENHDFDIVHFACHSSFDCANPEQSSLIVGTRALGPEKLSAVSLRKYMRNSQTQLAFLNSCRSGAQGVHGDSLGLVDSIVRGGVPSAIGMQWPINSQRAVEICREFYRRFVDGDSIESALRKCRRTIGATNGWHDLSWACPVLVQAPR